MAGLRAKFRVNAVKQVVGSSGGVESVEVELGAVYGREGTENAGWSKFTPSGSLRMTITNPVAFGVLLPGQEFYLDLVPA